MSIQSASFRSWLGRLMAAPFVVALAATASAQPIDPPPWWGVNDGFTTTQCWTFDTPDFPPKPDLLINPFGEPEWRNNGVEWRPEYNGRRGVWGQFGQGQSSFAVFIPNRRNEQLIKEVWLQTRFTEVPGQSDLSLNIQTEQPSQIENLSETVVDLGQGWFLSTVTFTIRPQPNWEIFEFIFTSADGTPAAIDDLYIGTHCVPEPASIIAIGGALAALAARRRRR